MREQGLTKEDLVRLSGLGRSTINRTLDETEHDARISTVATIAYILRVSIEEITYPYSPSD